MKQHITPEQLNELSEKGKERLRKWWSPKEGDFFDWMGIVEIAVRANDSYVCDSDGDFANTYSKSDVLPILSIGQMIEYLAEDWINVFVDWSREEARYEDQVCDALWEAVKEDLEK